MNLNEALDLVSHRLNEALSEREKIRKLSRELPRLRVQNKAKIAKLEKQKLDILCIIQMQSESQ